MKKLSIGLIIAIVVVHSSLIIPVCRQMVSLVIEQYLPSMFILLVLGKLYSFQSSTKKYRIPILNIDSACWQFIQCMIMIGYPVHARLINEQYEAHHLSEKQALRLIYAFSLPSLAFSLMTLSFLLDIASAFKLYLIQVSIGFFFFLLTRKQSIQLTVSSQSLTFMEQLRQSIRFAYHSLINILAFLMIAGTIKALLIHYVPFANNLVIILMEFSSACFLYASHPQALPILAFILGFGSISIHLQVLSSCTLPHFSYRRYFMFRIIQSILAFLLCKALL